MRAATCIQSLMEAARTHGPPLESWMKSGIKPLRSAFKRNTSAAPGTSYALVGTILIALSHERPLVRWLATVARH